MGEQVPEVTVSVAGLGKIYRPAVRFREMLRGRFAGDALLPLAVALVLVLFHADARARDGTTRAIADHALDDGTARQAEAVLVPYPIGIEPGAQHAVARGRHGEHGDGLARIRPDHAAERTRRIRCDSFDRRARDLVTLAQLIAFLSFQVRLLAGVQSLAEDA